MNKQEQQLIDALAEMREEEALARTTPERGDNPVRVPVGTVHGYLQDIGKSIVTFMPDINGYEVRDIGIDVPVSKFIDEIRDFNPSWVALSGFLTLAFDSMRDTVQAIEKQGLRSGRKSMPGGGQVDDAVRTYTGAGAYGSNAVAAVRRCRQWISATA